MTLKIKTVQMIDCDEFDSLVSATYGKPYCFQQQGECKGRGTFEFEVPNDHLVMDCENDTIIEQLNGPEYGVSFAAWLARDPTTPVADETDTCRSHQWAIDMFWHRNFFPDFQTLVNDMHAKGVLPAGKYTIDIDW